MLIDDLEARRAALKAEAEALMTTSLSEKRSLTDDENTAIAAKVEERKLLATRIEELRADAVAEAKAAETRVAYGVSATETATVSVKHEPNPVYRRNASGADASFFKDVFLTKSENDPEARSRLARSQETRAGDLVSVTATQGGTFAPPLWLVEDYIKLARPHRVTADLVEHETLPRGVSSINFPKVSTGAAAGVQVTQNSALTDTAMTTTSVSSGITLIAGKQIISRQLIDQSGIPFDRVILQDLAADYAAQLDKQVIYGTGSSGQLRGLATGGTTITFTTGSPAVVSTTAANSFYNAVIRAKNSVESNRYLPANAIVMRPDRWNWILEAFDSQSRPLVTPSTETFNGLASAGRPTAEGELAGQVGKPDAVGNLLGLPVYLDPNIPVTMNSATNQDTVIVLNTTDVWLYESELETASFDATYADNASILFRVLGYSALIPDRYAFATSLVLGTGMVQATL